MENSAHPITNPSTNTPRVPSPDERELYYYGLPSKPVLIARSSNHLWKLPTGPEAYLVPKECSPVGMHRLCEVWEGHIIPAMQAYLLKEGVQYTSLDPVRMGAAGQPTHLVIIWIGVIPDSLSSEQGIKVATHCRSILTDHAINDIHVEIRESQVTPSAKMYKPVISANPIVGAVEPFSTSLGISICNAATPSIEGTGGLFFTDRGHPGKLFLLTTRHVLIHPGTEHNDPYVYREGTGQPPKKVLLLGEAAFKARLKAIAFEIQCKLAVVDQLHMREWKDPENRIIGHLLLSPPISFNVGNDGFTEDWAVVEIYPTMIDMTNFVGNVIDLGTSIAVDELTAQMYPHVSNPTSFKYPGNRLFKFHGTIADENMYKLDPRTQDQDNEPVIMVLKRGNTSNLTVGRLNNIRSVTRVYVEGKLSGASREVAVLPRTSNSGAFSEPGDSGSAVVSGTGQVVGLITGGGGSTERFDCTYITSINFILNRLIEHRIHADIFPVSIGP
ncbi:hypothetical protein V565_080110 [Rhizoctonia solani 123E]|uniref:Uncharacterized protein n=1 Tax=Rhizoctonia solani 123E TaxID=1423351 RepID=A0A074RYQ1_9AGAM|nr:hypothetical protein V565_080110 [Rhizoctonia solani 123E]